MSSAAPTKRQHKPNTLPPGHGLADYYLPVLHSSIGGKMVVALTGIGLTLFVVMHWLGNMKIFAGRDSLNAYAQFLRDLGPLLWVARGGLLLLFVLHIYLSLRLKRLAAEARPIPYAYEKTIQASLGSRTMLYTGLVILGFTIYHLAHYTFGWVQTTVHDGKTISILDLKDPLGRHDVYAMVIAGFRNPLISLIYIVCQLFLLLHLSHGVGSVFQTLGLNAPRWQPCIKALGWAVALLVGLGNILIVVAVWTGWVRPVI